MQACLSKSSYQLFLSRDSLARHNDKLQDYPKRTLYGLHRICYFVLVSATIFRYHANIYRQADVILLALVFYQVGVQLIKNLNVQNVQVSLHKSLPQIHIDITHIALSFCQLLSDYIEIILYNSLVLPVPLRADKQIL